jgi:hypothetical protein
MSNGVPFKPRQHARLKAKSETVGRRNTLTSITAMLDRNAVNKAQARPTLPAQISRRAGHAALVTCAAAPAHWCLLRCLPVL